MMNNLQEMTSEEARYAWEEAEYHFDLVDIVKQMKVRGEGVVILDVLNMFKQSEQVK